ncbi:MAG: biotin--[acetyl-CoA-carboxylase] ligase [Bacteroidetes bacterium]|nr:MAG: biotin--[acetyl-CoA-carboxylase] ligase [Bacteroidota bacterium]
MRELIYIEECESTNVELSLLRESNSDEKEIVICTDYQSAGKGQGTNFWESKKSENLTFSYNLINTRLKAVNQFYISIIVSLSIVELLKAYLSTKTISIKWPNDVYIDNKKVAGILIENVIIGDKIKESYIGIGINVNQKIFDSNAPNPISIINYTEKESEIKELLSAYLLKFDYYLNLYKNGEFERLKTMYLDKLYRINEIGKYQINNEIIDGVIKGIDEYGFLSIMINGELKSFDIKQVKYL